MPGKSASILVLLTVMGFSMQSCTRGYAGVETGEITAVRATTADIAGHILSVGDGIKSYGHCYSQTGTPTISDDRTVFTVTIGVGSYSSHIINLLPGTTYHARAYAVSGKYTVYGKEVSFTTAASGRQGSPKIF
jgi:hypothetical protein